MTQLKITVQTFDNNTKKLRVHQIEALPNSQYRWTEKLEFLHEDILDRAAILRCIDNLLHNVELGNKQTNKHTH